MAVISSGRYTVTGYILKFPLRIKEVTLMDVLTATVVIGTIPATIYGLDDPLRRNAGKIFPMVLQAFNDCWTGNYMGSLGLITGGALFA